VLDSLQFTLANADMDGGLGNPAIAVAVALVALVFASWMVSVIRSRRTRSRKGLLLGVAFALAFPGTWVASFLGRLYTVARYSAPGVGIGFIGRPPRYSVPVAAVLLVLALLGASSLWRRSRAPASH